MTNYTSYHSCDIILYPLLHGIHIITPFIWSTLWLRIYKQRNGRTSIIRLFIHLFLAYIAKPFISTETPSKPNSLYSGISSIPKISCGFKSIYPFQPKSGYFVLSWRGLVYCLLVSLYLAMLRFAVKGIRNELNMLFC